MELMTVKPKIVMDCHNYIIQQGHNLGVLYYNSIGYKPKTDYYNNCSIPISIIIIMIK